jgi:hypothetical protein
MSHRCPVCSAQAAQEGDVVTCLDRCCGYAYHEDPRAPWREGSDWRPGVPTYATDSIYYAFVRSFVSLDYHRRNGSF